MDIRKFFHKPQKDISTDMTSTANESTIVVPQVAWPAAQSVNHEGRGLCGFVLCKI